MTKQEPQGKAIQPPQGKVIQLKPHRVTHTKSDTIGLSADIVGAWKAPPFQRPLRVNEKVRALVDKIRQDGGVVPGVITLGLIGRDTYLLDGQHRIHAFTLTELAEGFADVRVHHFDDVGQMGEEFVNLNSRLVNLQPDDILRGLEESTPALRTIRAKCPFVGYGNVRRNDHAPILSMSMLLRCWFGSLPETPSNSGRSAIQLASELTSDEADTLASTTSLLERAWGRDPEYKRLWGSLNLTIAFWLYRRTVVVQYSPNTARMTKDLFQKCMTSLSADSHYLDWLTNRNLSERDRSPAYGKMKALVAKRCQLEQGTKPRLPSPAWSKGHF